MPSRTQWNRILALATAGAIAATMIGRYVNSYLESSANHAFEQMLTGTTQQHVADLLGLPNSVRICGDSLWWGDDTIYRGKNDVRCVTETRYEHLLSVCSVGYSQDGYVVSKDHYSSE